MIKKSISVLVPISNHTPLCFAGGECVARTSGTASSWQQSHTSSRCTSPTSPCVRGIASAAHTSTLTQAGKKDNRASHARLFVQGGEESKCLLDRKRRFFSPRAGVDAQLQSKYAAICITTGNEVAAHTGCRLFVLGRVSFYTYALSISAPALMLSSPPPPHRPPATFFPF